MAIWELDRTATDPVDRPRLAVAEQSRRGGGGHAPRPHRLPDYGRRPCPRCRGGRAGAFSTLLALPAWVGVVASVVLLDLAIYFQHVLFHAVPVLWRLHRMHHADLDFDVTTGLRFHPIEILLSMVIKLAVVAALGAPALAVLIFEVLLNATSMFNHGNVRIPAGLDRVLRWVVVTPDMHRVHHSILSRETNSNFGFNLPWWDRLFGTYRAQPAAGHEGMTIGIEQFRDPRELRLDRMLLQPFRGDAGRYPLGRREQANNEHAPLRCRVSRSRCCSSQRRHGLPFIATRSIWRRSMLAGLARPVGADRPYGPVCSRHCGFRSGRVFALAGGALFGPFWGSLWNLLGATLGATLAFLVARYIVGDWVERNAGGLLKRLIDGVDAEGWRFVAFVRLVPLVPLQPLELRARAHPHPAPPLRHRHACLHGARRGRLHVARACRTRAR